LEISMSWFVRVLFAGSLLLFLSKTAIAVPILYHVDPGGSGIATAQVASSPTPLGTFVLNNITGTVTIESTTLAITDFEFSFGSTGLTPLSPGYGGYDRVQIDSLMLSPGTGFGSTITSTVGPTSTMTTGPVDVSSLYSSQDSTGTNPPANNIPLSFTAPSMSAAVTSDGATSVSFTGVPIAVIDPTGLTLPSPETDNLVVVAQFSFGASVPEPSTGLLFGIGLAALALGRRAPRT